MEFSFEIRCVIGANTAEIWCVVIPRLVQVNLPTWRHYCQPVLAGQKSRLPVKKSEKLEWFKSLRGIMSAVTGLTAVWLLNFP